MGSLKPLRPREGLTLKLLTSTLQFPGPLAIFNKAAALVNTPLYERVAAAISGAHAWYAIRRRYRSTLATRVARGRAG